MCRVRGVRGAWGVLGGLGSLESLGLRGLWLGFYFLNFSFVFIVVYVFSSLSLYRFLKTIASVEQHRHVLIYERSRGRKLSVERRSQALSVSLALYFLHPKKPNPEPQAHTTMSISGVCDNQGPQI